MGALNGLFSGAFAVSFREGASFLSSPLSNQRRLVSSRLAPDRAVVVGSRSVDIVWYMVLDVLQLHQVGLRTMDGGDGDESCNLLDCQEHLVAYGRKY